MVLFRFIKKAGHHLREFSNSSFRCEAVVISGKEIAKEIQDDLKITVNNWINSGRKRPRLSAILVGNNPASEIYIARKIKVAKSIGIEAETLHLNSSIKQDELIKTIHQLNDNPDVDGILVQLPLPSGLDEKSVCHAVSPSKDVDGFHSENLGKLSANCNGGFVPATALAVRELILRSGIETLGRNALIIGRSKHVGLPIALLLHANGKDNTRALDMTTTISHIHTSRDELIKHGKLADVIVSATGVPGLVTKDMIKPGACVIDVGITRININNGKSKIVGDVVYNDVKQIAGFITPVPGGVGPMTVIMLMKNTLLAAEKK